MTNHRRSNAGRTSFDRVRKLARDLPRVTVGTTFRSPALKLDGAVLACITTHKSAEPDTLAVRVGFFDRDYRIAKEPDLFYVKPHYVNYPYVLVRLARISDASLREVLESGWEFVSSRAKGRATRRRRERRPDA